MSSGGIPNSIEETYNHSESVCALFCMQQKKQSAGKGFPGKITSPKSKAPALHSRNECKKQTTSIFCLSNKLLCPSSFELAKKHPAAQFSIFYKCNFFKLFHPRLQASPSSSRLCSMPSQPEAKLKTLWIHRRIPPKKIPKCLFGGKISHRGLMG